MLYIYPYKHNTLDNNSILFDVGGHIGQFTSDAIKKINPYIYVYEPNKRLYKQLKRNFSNNKKIVIINKALYSKIQKIPLYITGRVDVGSSLDKNKVKNNIIKDVYNVYTTTIEKELEELNIDKIDYLKLNIEGSEYEILNNLQPHILNKIYQIGVSFHKGFSNHNDNEIKRIKDYLLKNKFIQYQMFNKNRGILFVREELI